MHERIRKINAVIEKELSAIMARDINFKPGVFVTISKVDTSDDMRYTSVFVRVFPQKDLSYAMATLEHERNTLQKNLHKVMPMRILPRLSFAHDPRGDEVDVIDRLLQSDADNHE